MEVWWAAVAMAAAGVEGGAGTRADRGDQATKEAAWEVVVR